MAISLAAMPFRPYAVPGAGRPWRAERPPCTAPLAPRPAGLVACHQPTQRLSRLRVLLRVRDQGPGQFFGPGSDRDGLARQHDAADLPADLGYRGAALHAERHD